MAILFLPLTQALAMPVGTLLYRTSGEEKMYGYNSDDLILSEKGKLAHIYSGHSAIYVGQENGIDYIVEMQPKGAIKVPAKYFINESLGEKLVGARLPINASPLQIAKAVSIAKNLASSNLAYDFDFKYQKGFKNGQWTCVGLTEKVYESANISNPTNLNSLEYNPDYYAVDITPDGYDKESVYNSHGDCFASNLEYSKITRKKNMIVPAPELIGFDVGLERDGDRYIFLPYTQYLQSSLKDVVVDITLSSSFSEPVIRGNSPILGLVLKWSLINNPVSTVKNLASKVVTGFVAIKDKVFPDSGVVLADNYTVDNLDSAASSSAKVSSAKTSSTKATSTKTTSNKVTTTQTPVTKTSAVKATSTNISAKVSSPKISTPVVSVSKISNSVSPVSSSSVAAVVPKISSVVRTTVRPNVAASTTTTVTSNRSTSTIVANHPISNTTINHVSSTPVIIYPSTTPFVTPAVTTSTEVTEPEIPIVLIAKIYSNDSDDWLEIVNTTNIDFDLAAAGYRLEKAKTGSDPTLIMRFGDEVDGVYPGGTIIKAYGSYLVARDSSSSEIKARADAIITKTTFSWTDDAYTLYLGTASISSDDDEDIIDKVGYGTAQYFEGAPAPALKKGYALERKASATSTLELLSSGGLHEFWPRLFDSDDNSDDFLLVPYDLALIESENQVTEDNPINHDLFVSPAGLNSENLTQLWHFDECYGETAANELQISDSAPVDFKRPAKWLPGKWGCAASLSYNDASSTKAIFSSPLDPNQFSLNLYYRNTQSSFAFYLNFFNPASSGQQAYIEFTPYFTTVYGFPGPEGRLNDVVWPNDLAWHQVSVVVNRSGGYWALYLDGQEVYSYHYNGIMPTFDYFEIRGNYSDPVAIDELSIWDRSLPASEINTINLLNQPFNPYNWPTAQTAAKLEHYWSFDENAGLITKDLVASDDMPLMLEHWDMEGRNSSALKLGQSINLPLASLSVSDLSLSYWWRNTESPNEGRARVMLKGDSGNIMSLTPTIYNPSFGFNGDGGYLTNYGDSLFPTDNQWHHVVLTYDSYRYLLSFYLDGVKKMEKQLIKLRTGEKIEGLEIVKENYPSSLDELKVWSGTLTPAQVLTEYNTFK